MLIQNKVLCEWRYFKPGVMIAGLQKSDEFHHGRSAIPSSSHSLTLMCCVCVRWTIGDGGQAYGRNVRYTLSRSHLDPGQNNLPINKRSTLLLCCVIWFILRDPHCKLKECCGTLYNWFHPSSDRDWELDLCSKITTTTSERCHK